jgi:hypothetical protein
MHGVNRRNGWRARSETRRATAARLVGVAALDRLMSELHERRSVRSSPHHDSANVMDNLRPVALACEGIAVPAERGARQFPNLFRYARLEPKEKLPNIFPINLTVDLTISFDGELRALVVEQNQQPSAEHAHLDVRSVLRAGCVDICCA